MLSDISLNLDADMKQLGLGSMKQDFCHLLTTSNPIHPALSRVRMRLGALTGIESQITSYDRMHHRHNRA